MISLESTQKDIAPPPQSPIVAPFRTFSRLLPSISRLEIFLCPRRGQALARERKARWMICCG